MRRPFEILAAGLVLGELTMYAGSKGAWAAAGLAAVCFAVLIFLSWERGPRVLSRRQPLLGTGQRKRCRAVTLLLALGFLLGALRLYQAERISPEERSLDLLTGGSTAELTLTCRAEQLLPGRDGRVHVRSGLLLISCPEELVKEEGIQCGYLLSVSGRLSRIAQATNPGEFDFASYYRAQGVTHRLSAERITVERRRPAPLSAALFRLRGFCTERFSSLCAAEDAGFLNAALFGDKTALPEELYERYRRNGIAHLLAISGLHTALLGLGLYRLLRRWGMSYSGSGLSAGLFLLCYCLLTGAGTGVVRAVIMLLLSFVADVLGRGYDLRSAVGIAGIAMLLAFPLELFQCGFQLSFLAVLFIAGPGASLWRELLWRRERWRKKRERKGNSGQKSEDRILCGAGLILFETVAQALVMGISVTLGTLPVIAYWFFSVPLYSVLLNLLVIPLMAYLLWTGISLLVLLSLEYYLTASAMAKAAGILPPLRFLAQLAAGIIHRILQFYTLLCAVSEQLPYHSVLIGRPKLWQIALYYLLLLLSLYGFCQGAERAGGLLSCICKGGAVRSVASGRAPAFAVRRLRLFIWGSRLLPSLLLCLALCSLRPLRSRCPRLWFLDIGQGDAIVIEQGARCILIDGGSSSNLKNGAYILRPFLLSRALREVDAAFITHSDVDHTNGVAWLMKEAPEFRFHRVVLNAAASRDELHYGRLKELIKENGAELLFMGAGESLGSFYCLWPRHGEVAEDVNEQSLVLLFQYGAEHCLFTGDAGTPSEEQILAVLTQQPELCSALRGIRLLKAGHHGSRGASCEAWLTQLQPETTVLCCGRNNRYGHPHEDTLQRLEAAGTEIRCTAEEGAVCIELGSRKKRKLALPY